MLLVTLLFVLTTRGVSLDFYTPIRNGTRADFLSPVSSPPMKRHSSAFLPQDQLETERTLDPTGELRKLRLNWRNLPPSRDSVQSAPASPPSLLPPWNSLPASSANHNRTPSDEEETQEGDNESAHLPSRGFGRGSLDEFFGTNEERVEDVDYPTPSSNEEILE